MRLAIGFDAQVADWVAARIPQVDKGEDFGPCAAIGIVNSTDELIGGWVFHTYHPRFRSIEISAASAGVRWVSPTILSGLFAYPFDDLGVKRVAMVTTRQNKQARACILKMGFKFEGIARSAFGGSDGAAYSLLVQEWRRSPLNVANRVRMKEAA